MLDEQTAAYVHRCLSQRGVELLLQTQGRAFIGDHRAEAVELTSGITLHADILIAATGVRPNLDFVEGSNLEHGWGLRVDKHLRASSANIYAAGDVVEVPNLQTGQVAVHPIFPNAVEQGRVVGLNLAGIPTEYEGAWRMNSLKHLGLPVMAVGLKQGDQVLHCQSDGCHRSLYLQENRLVGFQLVGDIHAAGALHTLLQRGQDLRLLKDELLSPSFGQGVLTWQALTATG
jgi:NAD(P)H-nitrite reductase large subunit